MHVATISYEDVPSCPRKTANGNLFLFRLGNLRNSYAQKQAEANEYKSSLLIQSPPAYEQVSTASPKPQEEDAKSLPPYEEVEKTPKSSDV